MEHAAKEQLGSLPIAMNSFVVQLDTLKGVVETLQRELTSAEKYSLIRKQEPFYNYARSQTDRREGFSFERDIRGYISCIEGPLLLEVSREQSFMPVVSRKGWCSLEQAEQFVLERQQKAGQPWF
jgi:hypothetical protein